MKFLKRSGLALTTQKVLLMFLNNSYWVVDESFDGKFAYYNLYNNRFSEALSLVAYTDAGRSDEAFDTSAKKRIKIIQPQFLNPL